MEVALKGLFNAFPADEGVHGIALLQIALDLVVVYRADVAQQMGGVHRVVLTDIADLHVEAQKVALHQPGYKVYAHVLSKNVGRGLDDIARVQLVAHARNDAGLLGIVAVVDTVALAQEGHQLHRRRVLRQLVLRPVEAGVGDIGV